MGTYLIRKHQNRRQNKLQQNKNKKHIREKATLAFLRDDEIAEKLASKNSFAVTCY